MSFPTLEGGKLRSKGEKSYTICRFMRLKTGVEDFSSPANAHIPSWFVRFDIVFQLIIEELKMCTHTMS